MEDDILIDDSDSVVHLKNLIKSSSGKGIQDLSKAKDKGKKEDEPDDDDDYDETYMKKHMKKFTGKNPDYMKNAGYMKKAKDGMDAAYSSAKGDGDLVADATMIEGTEMFNQFMTLTGAFMKALEVQGERIEKLEESIQYSNEIVAASGEVLIKASETLDKVATEPNPVKTQTVGSSVSFQKAAAPTIPATHKELMEEVQNLDFRQVKQTLFKAATENGNGQAGLLLSKVEMANGNLARLDPQILKSIIQLTKV